MFIVMCLASALDPITFLLVAVFQAGGVRKWWGVPVSAVLAVTLLWVMFGSTSADPAALFAARVVGACIQAAAMQLVVDAVERRKARKAAP